MASLHEADSEYVRKDEGSGDNPSRNIGVTVDKSNASSNFEVVEETNWNEATWRRSAGGYTLIANGSDVFGTLRFMGPRPEGSVVPDVFLVALGNDTDTWCDLKVDLGRKPTGAFYQPLYYVSGTPENSVKEKHQKSVTKTFTTSGIKVSVRITGNELEVAWE